MRITYLILSLVLTIALNGCNTEVQTKDPLSDESLYFGQEPPGLKSEPLERGIVTTDGWELGGVFTPDKKEFYFTAADGDTPLDPTVTVFREENRVWKKYNFYSAGSDTLYMHDKYIERTGTGWSKVKSLGAPFDTIPIMRLTASLKGTLVFDEWTPDGSGLIRYSRLVNGKREAPKPFGAVINTGKWKAHPFIAPDESYLIWDSEREGDYGEGDMYISFKQPDGTWGAAINFGDKINTDGEDGGGYVTPDGKYLRYCPRCIRPYDRMWVDAQIIEDLRAKQ